MRKPIPTNRRRSIVRAALAASGTAIALLPLATPWTLQAHAGDPAPVRKPPSAAPLPELAYPAAVVVRDPFAGAPGPGSETAAVAAPRVGALVLGAHPRALIENGERAELVGVGSAVGSAVVTAITSAGVLLDDGTTIPFGPERP